MSGTTSFDFDIFSIKADARDNTLFPTRHLQKHTQKHTPTPTPTHTVATVFRKIYNMKHGIFVIGSEYSNYFHENNYFEYVFLIYL